MPLFLANMPKLSTIFVLLLSRLAPVLQHASIRMYDNNLLESEILNEISTGRTVEHRCEMKCSKQDARYAECKFGFLGANCLLGTLQLCTVIVLVWCV